MNETRRRVAILGSTGSIGTQALEVIARHPTRFQVVALAAGRRVGELARQAREFDVPLVACAEDADVATLRAASPTATRVLIGAGGLRTVAAESGAHVVLAASDGLVAFDAVFAAVENGVDLAIANKELIVAAGEPLLAAAARSSSRILPVDSEHSAIFQCLLGEAPNRVAGIVLTASGGPFWNMGLEEMAGASVTQALRHPTWSMGVKNTIDSATMMNKGLEVIEACRLFGLPPERVHVLVHRTSMAHGLVIFRDGSVKAQLALPDMRIPIGYALAYPDRLPDIEEMDPLAALGAEPGGPVARLTFERPDLVRFPCLALAYRAIALGGTFPAVLSAANELAVAAFIRGRLRFGQIAEIIRTTLDRFDRFPVGPLTLAAIREADTLARTTASALIAEFGSQSWTLHSLGTPSSFPELKGVIPA
ncbi:MAG TPA: 1-deoxy-D-xylulose-5-phosphate reductoisomerase [Candidatus Baltobacteraceae bacterium]|jgi:1-deoxy-D-xylulose-5-phosphate reductoisomerase|nr:1-deoxy-D-xylulose-5-phosphate reductoisomerase [Candidatus Baltobacteraceae bacterium]